MRSFPFFFRLKGLPCWVAGGGEGARHKASLLLKAGASVTLFGDQLHPSTRQLVQEGQVQWRQQRLQADDLQQLEPAELPWLLIADEDEALNRELAEVCARRRVLFNAVDMPAIGDFFFPSILERGPLSIAIGSDGSAPILVRHMRARLESLLPKRIGELGELVQQFKDAVRERFPNLDRRRRFWDEQMNGPVAEQVLAGRSEQAAKMLQQSLQQATDDMPGEVYLVGAGPGDPDLLTFKALRLMQQADVVMYDRLVSEQILECVRRESERIFVGKGRNIYSITQDNINQALVDYARQGKRVLRLKGGDPFIFGRGGEELERLAEAGISFQVVPGITAASGCASYAGIPLTHRDYAQSVRFITGHRVGGELNLDWKEYVQPGQTLVFYMGLNGLEIICDKLLEYGAAADLPVALVEKGTRIDQRVFVGTLTDLPSRVREAGAEAPTLIIVGQVVRLQDKLAWWNTETKDKSP